MIKKLFMIVVIFFVFILPVNAHSSIHFENGAKELFVNPEHLDLFQNFEGIVPGGHYQQSIELKNNSNDTVNMYFRRYEVDSKYNEMLSHMHLSLYLDDQLMFESKPHHIDHFDERTLIAEMGPQETNVLTVLLEVDEDMKNDFQNKASILNWEFYAEQHKHDRVSERPSKKPPVVRPVLPSPPLKEGVLPSTGMGDMLSLGLLLTVTGLALHKYRK